MPLTPADVHNVFFKRPAVGTRGYDEDQVDAFLDVVEAELARLIEENKGLRAGRTNSVTDEPPGVSAAPPPVTQPWEDASVRASRLLALATETADRYVGEAKQRAERMVVDAKGTRKQILSETGAKSRQMVSEARLRADSLISDARSRAEMKEREARGKAAELEEAERRHTEVISSLEEKRRSLEPEIEQLRSFEREYRSCLRSHLEAHLRDLDRRGSAEPRSRTRQSQPLIAGIPSARSAVSQPSLPVRPETDDLASPPAR